MVVGVEFAKAQRLPAYSHFFYNQMLYNPSFTGETNLLNAMLLGNYQWFGFEGAPKTMNLLMEGNIKNKKIGVGLNVSNYQIGIHSQTGGKIFYSYRAYLNRDAYLTFGANVGFFKHSLLLPINEELIAPDPILNQGTQNKVALDADAGLGFVYKSLKAGLAITQILGNRVKFSNELYYKQTQKINVHVKYDFNIGEEHPLTLTPLFLGSYRLRMPFYWELSTIGKYKDDFWTGVTYKSSQELMFNVGYSINGRYNIGYAYGYSLNQLGTYAGASHEVMLNVILDRKAKKKKEGEEEAEPQKDLNTILFEKLLAEIEALLDAPEPNAEKIAELSEKVASFKDSHFSDPSLKAVVNNVLKSLQQIEVKVSKEVVVKGEIGLTGKKKVLKANYDDVEIQIIDPETEAVMGIYRPRPRSGKYVLILTQGVTYILQIDKEGYHTYRKEFTPKIRKQNSYEIRQSARLKHIRIKKVKLANK